MGNSDTRWRTDNCIGFVTLIVASRCFHYIFVIRVRLHSELLNAYLWSFAGPRDRSNKFEALSKNCLLIILFFIINLCTAQITWFYSIQIWFQSSNILLNFFFGLYYCYENTLYLYVLFQELIFRYYL